MSLRIWIVLLASGFCSLALKCEMEEECMSIPFTTGHYSLSVLDNSGAEPRVSEDGSAGRTSAGLRIAWESVPDSLVDTIGYTCFNYFPTKPVYVVSVRALNDFGPNDPAGADISRYFKLRTQQSVNPYPGLVQYYSLENTWVFHQYEPESKADLLLIDYPEQPGVYRFEVQLTQSDSSLISLQTDLKLY